MRIFKQSGYFNKTEQMFDVSIIIVNYNTYELICNCINSIIDQTTGILYEIIVVDNNSKKENPDLIKNKFHQINLIKSSKNLGFAGGNNLGISEAKGKYILLLNSDTIIVDNAIYECFNRIIDGQKDRVDLLACKLVNIDGSFQPSTSGKELAEYSFYRQCFLFELYENNPFLYHINKAIDKYRNDKSVSSYSYENDIYNTMYVSGAFMLFSRDLIEDIGSLDNDFFMYYEEIEWLYRMWSRGYKILYYPIVKIIHLGRDGSGSDKMISQKIISKYLMYYKNHGIKGYVMISLVNIINLFFNILAMPFLGNNGRSISMNFVKNYIISLRQILGIPFKYNTSVSCGNNPLIANNLK